MAWPGRNFPWSLAAPWAFPQNPVKVAVSQVVSVVG